MQWNFYYCHRCRGWSQAPYRYRHIAFPVRDKNLSKSLTWFCATEEEMLEDQMKVVEWLRSFWNRIKNGYFRILFGRADGEKEER